MGRFKGQVVVITGASAGIGEAAARGFAEEGARLVLAARRRGPLEALAEELREGGADVAVIPTDVGDNAACEALIAGTLERFGRVDVLVNNAGAHYRGGFHEHDAERFATMVDVNLRGPIVLTRHALEPMRRAGRGAIVNVASLAGRVPLPGAAVYSSTKWGMRSFSLALAEELRDTGIRVTVVSPGPVDTGFIMEELETVSPLALSQPLSTAEEVAEAVLACAHDGKPERALPRLSGMLTTVAYLVPRLGRALRPFLRQRGERVKRALLRAQR